MGFLKMKKIVGIVSVSLLFLVLSMSSAFSTTLIESVEYTVETEDMDQPDWATGGFRGVIGRTNANGRPAAYSGYIAGFYENEEFNGRFIGALARRNTSDPIGFIRGYIKGPFMIGFIGSRDTDGTKPIVGIGVSNETHAYYRTMSLVGPTVYIACRYNSF